MILAGGDAKLRATVREFGYDIGLAFQVTDDILDIVGDEADLGKKVGKDAAVGKATFIGPLGVDGAKREAVALVERANARLAEFGGRAQTLRAFGEYVLTRRS